MTHRECVQVPFSRGDALEWLGHGEGSRRRFRPELEKNRESERLGGAGSAPGHALGSQEGGGDGGELKMAREVVRRAYGAVELRGVPSVAEVRKLEVGRAESSKGRGEGVSGIHVAR